MKKRIISMMLTAVLGISLVLGAVPAESVSADAVAAKPYISFGADLNKKEKASVMSMLGVNQSQLGQYQVITVTNDEEHKYLDSYLSKDVIGTRALSSVKIEKAEEGKGIQVTTHNINYCSSGMYTNALTTAGVMDATVTVAGPFELSGTAALVGTMKAYESMTGKKLEAANEDAAVNELVVTSELGEEVGADKAERLVALAKQKIIDGNLSSQEDIEKAIKESAEQVDIKDLTDEQIKELASLFEKIKSLNLDIDKIKQQAETVYNRLQELGENVESAKGILEKLVDFFESIANSIANLF